ncbi:MAG TPA: tripartite tricarboxylate transporter substrate binding protein [Burkholderiales bacterium]|nr:tripartite tricarboxylate transporter substrate binding protein [Burkholderiales bacterium]
MLKDPIGRLCMLTVLTIFPISASPAQADRAGAYPTKPIRLIVPLTAGGPTDLLARIIAVPLSDALGQQVIVDNRPGAGGNIGADIAAKSPADGYTLFMGTSGPLSINSTLYPRLPFDPIRDFAPIILAASAPFVVIVHPSVAAQNMKELIALAKAKPGQLNYGSVPGSASHLSTELFKMMAGVNIVHIPYKGAAPATTDVIAGQIQMSFASTPGSVPVVKAGKVKALGVTSAKRIGKLPAVPTVAESALPGYEASVWYGVVAPARTPREVVQRLNKEIAAVVANPTHRERMLGGDFEPTTSTPEQFGAFIKSETAKWGKVVKASGAKAE